MGKEGDELLRLLESQAAAAKSRSRELAYIATMSGSDKHKWQREADAWDKFAKKWEEAIILRRKETERPPPSQ
jgi:hypothetical protein